jgi:hypothetical protein
MFLPAHRTGGMGYACPVCELPQADAEHLANHMAFTAVLGDADHEAWLDDRVPDWESRGPTELAPAVVEHAPEAEDPRVFEDTTDSDHAVPDGLDRQRAEDLDGETERVLREARELTERMRDRTEE